MLEEPKTPWLGSYGNHKFHLDYPDRTISEQILHVADKLPENPAFSFQGRTTSYREFKEGILRVAKALKAMGIKEGDVVTVSLPNCPQAVMMFYAINYIGAVAAMIHPLSAVGEIAFYLKETDSKYAITLDAFYPKFKEVEESYKLEKLIITSVSDALHGFLKFGFWLTQGRKIEKPKEDEHLVLWKNFLNRGNSVKGDVKVKKTADDVAVILFSGGTTGKTKGILLSNLNMNALAYQTREMSGVKDLSDKSMLAAMPVFHGFGLGVCVHTMLCCGGKSILVPRFNVKSYSELIVKERPNFIAGVPSLFEAITRVDIMNGKDLSCLLGVFSGGDSLSIELKKKIDEFLSSHNAGTRVREGYGTTECVTASCLTPIMKEKEGSIGIPYPDTYYMICKVGSTEEVPYGTEGEICLMGPTVMKGYLKNPNETKDTLVMHPDGNVWLHTGDLGVMDEEGYIYFKQRLKRMIITNGYNVYPSQLENIIEQHEAVQISCVIGVKDPRKMQKVKAYVVLRPGFKESPELIESIFAHCRKHIAKYMMPYEIEVRTDLPKTKVGKIAYTVLEAEAEALEEKRRAGA